MRKTKKRFLSALLACAMIVSLFPFAAFADSTSLPAANANGVIKLTEDVTVADSIVIDKDTTIDLNGHELTYNGNDGVFVNVKSGTLTVCDTSANADGRLYVNEQTTATGVTPLRCVQVYANAGFTLESGTVENTCTAFEATQTITNYGTVTIKGGTVKGSTGIFMFAPTLGMPGTWDDNSAVCNISGGTVQGVAPTTNEGQPIGADQNWSYGIAIYGPGVANGNVDNSKVALNISGGTITAGQAIGTNASGGQFAGYTLTMTGGTVDGTDKGTGMYLPAIGVNNISGGTVTGAQGIRICAGDLNITGGTIEGTALSDNSDLVAGGSGGTNGAIVVGKASGGYVGNLNVNISGQAQVVNTATKSNDADVAPAIVVSDKNMGNESMGYDDLSINVNVSGQVTGDIVKVSNLTPGAKTTDGGNTTLSLDGCTVSGNVTNSSKTPVSVENSTITGNVTNTSEGSLLVDTTTVQGKVSNSGSGQAAVFNSAVSATSGSNMSVIGSTVAGQPAQDTAADDVVAFVNAVPYDSLTTALQAANDGDVVRLVKDVTVDVTGNPGSGAGALTIDKNITLDGNGKTITAGNGFSYNTDGTRGEYHVINVTKDATNVVIKNLTIDGDNSPSATTKTGARSGINVWSDDKAQPINVTIDNVTVKDCSTYGLTLNNANATVNGLTTSGNAWGGINVEGKYGNTALTVNDANIAEDNSIKFEQSTGAQNGPGTVSGTINGGSFQYVTTGDNVDLNLLVNGGTFATGDYAGAVDISDYLAPGMTINPSTGEVYEIPPYTGKYSYAINVANMDNGSVSVDKYATEGEKVTLTVSPDKAYKLDELTLTANGKEVEVTDNGDGTYTFTMPSGNVKVSVTFVEDEDYVEPDNSISISMT
ncbi:MAG: hypothetical protein UDG94_04825, partial [Peptococcaceae bacterium]|nr:hypothetical protein [Peptococcaceae bacterium]